MKTCGQCKHFIGAGDWNLCCSIKHPTPKEKERGLDFYWGHLCYEDTEACDAFEESERKWCVYIHTNKHNNKAYIGITSQKIEDRWGNNGVGYLRKNKDGSDKQTVFARAIRKYSDWENDWDHIIFADHLLQEEATHIEVLLIALYQTNCYRYRHPSYGYNMTDGGEGTIGYHHTDKTKETLRIASTGKKPSEETRKKLSDKLIQRWSNPNYKEKMRAIRKGIVRPKEVGCSISNAKGGKPVIQYSIFGEYIREYEYIADASNITGINSGSIYNVCCKKKVSAGGYRWRFVDEPLTDEEIKEIHNQMNNVKGVYENKRNNTWRAVLKKKHIGTYKNKDDAIIARLNAELLTYGYNMAPQYYLFEQYGITNQNDYDQGRPEDEPTEEELKEFDEWCKQLEESRRCENNYEELFI